MKKNEKDGEIFPKEILSEEYSLVGTSCQWQCTSVDVFNKVIVINSEQELENYIVCESGSYPEIDFSKYSLIYVNGMASSSPASVINKQLLQTSNNEYSLHLVIRPGPLATSGHWVMAMKVQKLSHDAVFILNIDVHR